MTQQSINYAKVLYQLNISREIMREVAGIFCATPELTEVLASPVVSPKNKHNIIDRSFGTSHFTSEIIHFLKVLCDCKEIESVNEICDAYEQYFKVQNDILSATLFYVTLPDQEQQKKMEKFLCDRFGTKQVEFQFVEKPELVGGFMIQAGDKEYDCSLTGSISQLQEKLLRR